MDLYCLGDETVKRLPEGGDHLEDEDSNVPLSLRMMLPQVLGEMVLLISSQDGSMVLLSPDIATIARLSHVHCCEVVLRTDGVDCS